MFLLQPSETTVHRSAYEIRTSSDSISCFIKLCTDCENRFLFYSVMIQLGLRLPYFWGLWTPHTHTRTHTHTHAHTHTHTRAHTHTHTHTRAHTHTHTHTPGIFYWTSDQLVAQALIDTRNIIYAFSGIRTRDPNNKMATDLSLSPQANQTG
jgi:hypothetical protein